MSRLQPAARNPNRLKAIHQRVNLNTNHVVLVGRLDDRCERSYLLGSGTYPTSGNGYAIKAEQQRELPG